MQLHLQVVETLMDLHKQHLSVETRWTHMVHLKQHLLALLIQTPKPHLPHLTPTVVQTLLEILNLKHLRHLHLSILSYRNTTMLHLCQ